MIRRAKAKDLDSISQLWQDMAAYHSEIDPQLFRVAADGARRYAQSLGDRLDDPWACILVADVDGEIAGYALGWIADFTTEMFEPTRSGFLADICVGESWRRRGIGRRLVEEMARWFAENDAPYYEWHVSAGNAAALAFWRSIGGRTSLLRMRADCGGDS